MSLYATRDQKRHAAARRAQFALATALRRIDYMEQVKDELRQMETGEAELASSGDYGVDAQRALEPAKLPEGD